MFYNTIVHWANDFVQFLKMYLFTHFTVNNVSKHYTFMNYMYILYIIIIIIILY